MHGQRPYPTHPAPSCPGPESTGWRVSAHAEPTTRPPWTAARCGMKERGSRASGDQRARTSVFDRECARNRMVKQAIESIHQTTGAIAYVAHLLIWSTFSAVRLHSGMDSRYAYRRDSALTSRPDPALPTVMAPAPAPSPPSASESAPSESSLESYPLYPASCSSAGHQTQQDDARAF